MSCLVLRQYVEIVCGVSAVFFLFALHKTKKLGRIMRRSCNTFTANFDLGIIKPSDIFNQVVLNSDSKNFGRILYTAPFDSISNNSSHSSCLDRSVEK